MKNKQTLCRLNLFILSNKVCKIFIKSTVNSERGGVMNINKDIANGNKIGYIRIPHISLTLKEYKDRVQEMLQLL